MGDRHRTRVRQVSGDECSVAGNHSSDLGFLADEQSRGGGAVRSTGRSPAKGGAVELVEPRNGEVFRRRWADGGDRHSVERSHQREDLIPIGRV